MIHCAILCGKWAAMTCASTSREKWTERTEDLFSTQERDEPKDEVEKRHDKYRMATGNTPVAWALRPSGLPILSKEETERRARERPKRRTYQFERPNRKIAGKIRRSQRGVQPHVPGAVDEIRVGRKNRGDLRKGRVDLRRRKMGLSISAPLNHPCVPVLSAQPCLNRGIRTD